MAVKNYYLTATTADGWRTIDEATQAAATNADGWIVSTGATNHAEYAVGVERAATTFTATIAPDGTLDTTLKDAFRSTSPLTGRFASGSWQFNFVVRAVTNAGTQNGRIRFRMIKANADGSNATEITLGQQSAGLTGAIANTTADFTSTVSFNPGAFTILDQYLFIQIAWERTAAGAMTSSDVNWRTGSSTSAGTRIVTADFTVEPLIVGAHIPNAYGKVVRADGAVGHWQFKDGKYVDAIGSAHGTLTSGSVSSVAGAPGFDQALSFTGSTGQGKVTIPHASNQNIGPTGSIECWVKVPAMSTNQAIVLKGAYAVAWGYGLVFMQSGTNRLSWRRGGGEYMAVDTPTWLTRNAWTHIVACASDSPTPGSDYKLYFNGVQYTGTLTWLNSSGEFFFSTTEPMSFGHARGTPSEYINGEVDEIAIYPTFLNATQVAAHYNAQSAGLFAPTVEIVLPPAQDVTGSTIASGSSVLVPTVTPALDVTTASIGTGDRHGVENFNANGTVAAANRGQAQSFRLTSTTSVWACGFYLSKGDAGSAGSFRASIYATTGTHGTDAKPTGSALAISDLFGVAGLLTTPDLILMPFFTPVTLTANVTYAVVIELVSWTSGGLRIGHQSSGTHSGNRATSVNVSGESWGTIPDGVDLIFEVLARNAQVFPPSIPEAETLTVTVDTQAATSNFNPGAPGSPTATSTLTVNLTVGDHPGRYLLVGIGGYDATLQTVSSVSWKGVTTGFAQIASYTGGTAFARQWGLVNPATGNGDLVITMSGSCANLAVTVLSVYNVHQTTPLGSTLNNDATGTPNITVSAVAKALVVDLLYTADSDDHSSAMPTLTPGAGQTLQSNVNLYQASWGSGQVASSSEPGAASVAMTWTTNSMTPSWLMLATVVKPMVVETQFVGAAQIVNSPARYAPTVAVGPVAVAGATITSASVARQPIVTHRIHLPSIQTIDYYVYGDEGGSNYLLALGHEAGQSLLGTGRAVQRATFWLARGTSGSGTAVFRIFAATGTHGSTAKPTGAVLATSESFDVSTLPVNPTRPNYVPITLTFPDGGPILTNGVTYCVTALKQTEVTGGTSDRLLVLAQVTSPFATHAGNQSLFLGATWGASAAADLPFAVASPGGSTAFAPTIIQTLAINLPTITPTVDSYTSAATGELGITEAVGQSFKGDGRSVLSVQFTLLRYNDVTAGTLTAKIYATTGTHGSSAVPTGAALLTSTNTVDATTLPLTPSASVFTFNFNPAGTPLTAGVTYAVVVELTGYAGTGAVVSRVDYATPSHSGNIVFRSGGSWSSDSGGDLFFAVFSGVGAVVSAPTVTIPSGLSITAGTVASTATLNPPFPYHEKLQTARLNAFRLGQGRLNYLIPVVLLPTVTSTAQVSAPIVSVTAGATFISSTAQVRVPTVAPGPVTITTAHRMSTASVAAPTVAPGPVTITTAHRASTATLTAPSVAVGPGAIVAATIASGSVPFPPILAQTITTAFISGPAPFVDNFAYSDGALPTVSGGVWAKPSDWPNPLAVQSNLAKGTASGDNACYLASWAGSTTAQYSEIVVSTFDNFMGPTVFNSAVGDFYFLDARSDLWVLYRVNSNQIFTSLTSASPGPMVVGDRIRLEVRLDIFFLPVLVAKKNGNVIISDYTSFTNVLPGGVPGFRLWNTTARVSEFSAGSIGAAVYAPTVTVIVPGQEVTSSHIGSTAVLYTPSAVPGAVTATLPVIATTASLNAPIVGTFTAVVGAFIGSTSTTHAPTTRYLLTTGFIGSTVSVRVPSVATLSFVTGAFIGSTTLLYAPTGAPGAVAVTTTFITSVAVARQPSVAVGAVTVTLPRINSTAQLFQHIVSTGQITIITAAIGSTAGLSPPTIAAGAVSITSGTVARTSTAFPPTGAAALVVGTIASTAVARVPAVTVAFQVTTNFIASTATLFTPRLPSLVAQAHIASTATAFPPTTLPIITVTGGTRPPTASLTGPSLVQVTLIASPIIPSTANLFPVTLTVGAVSVVSGTIGPGAVAYAPGAGAQVGVGFIAPTVALYGPELSPRVAVSTIASAARLFSPFTGAESYATAAFIGPTDRLFAPKVRPLGILIPAPPQRTFVIPFEYRTFKVPFEERGFIVPFEYRVHKVPFEQRRFVVPFEYRHWEERYAVPVRYGGKGSRR